MASLTINIGKREIYFLVTIAVFLISLSFIVAFNWGSGEPSVMGHTSNEVGVNVSGDVKTLQQAIDDGDLSIDLSRCYICLGWSDLDQPCCDSQKCIPLKSNTTWTYTTNFEGDVNQDDRLYMRYYCN